MRRGMIVTLTATALCLANAAHAQDAEVIFENAIDPGAAEQILAASGTDTAAEALFVGWLTSRHLHQDAVDRGADAAEISVLLTAAHAAGAAYEAALIAQNTVQLASVEPVVLTDEAFAQLIEPVAE